MWIKICGINDLETARQIAKLRPDAIGLNFYDRSVRAVVPETARQIASELPPEVRAIGIFVEASAAEIRQIGHLCPLGGIQLHAAGLNDAMTDLGNVPLKTESGWKRIRAFRIGARRLAPVAEYFDRERGRTSRADAYLVDAEVEGLYGGTGRTVSCELLQNDYRKQEWPPLILAGGLCPENVGAAIAAVRPWGVDVASGVESSPGVKDLALVERFIEEARRAFAQLKRQDAAVL